MAKSRRVQRGASSNFPGLAYVQRVGTRWLEAMVEQAHAGEEVWEEARSGNFELKSLAKLFTTSVDSYYGVLTDALRLSDNSDRPVWLHMPYSKKREGGGTLERSVALERTQPPETEARGTAFINMEDRTRIDDLLYDNIEISNGRTLLVKLTSDAVSTVAVGQYMSFIFADGRGAGAPLAIVVLTVEP